MIRRSLLALVVAAVPLAAQVPSITSLSPTSVTAGSASFQLTVTWTGYPNALSTTVYWNSAALSSTVISSTQVRATVPASYVGTPGSASISVRYTYPGTSVPGSGQTASRTFFINAPPLNVSCPASTGQVGVAYTSTAAASGGTPPYTWSIQGSLPPGLSLLSGGRIAGTPQQPGVFSFTVSVRDSAIEIPSTDSASCSIQIGSSPPVPACPALTTGRVGVSYSSTATYTGGYFPPGSSPSWTVVSGSLPPGLNLTPGTGSISGIPTTAGNYPFSLRVTDYLQQSGTVSCSIRIDAALSASCPALTTGRVGVPFSSSATVTGATGTLFWAVISGGLPPGLGLQPASGLISGTPTTAGNYPFTLRVTTSTEQQTTVSCSIRIDAASLVAGCPAHTARVGTFYDSNATASGGVSPYGWSLVNGSLPPGFNPLGGDGRVFGTPTTPGTYPFTLRVQDSSGQNTTIQCDIHVEGQPIVAACPASTGRVGVNYSSSATASGGTGSYFWALETGFLPPGLSLTPTSGLISGTPSAPGLYPFTLRVRDATQQTTAISCSIRIDATTLSASCSLNPGTVGVPYSGSLSALGGAPPYIWTRESGTLPPGLDLNPSGFVFGTPTAAGPYAFLARVRDSGEQTATTSCSIRIDPPVSTVQAYCTLGPAKVGQFYSGTLSATGGTSPYNWAIEEGTLPAGLVFTPAGTLSGIPQAVTPPVDLLFRVRDSSTPVQSATTRCTLRVLDPLRASCSVRRGVVGTAYSDRLTAQGGTEPYNWVMQSGSLPAGISLSPTGALTGTPTASGTSSFVAQVSDSAGGDLRQTATASCSLVIDPRGTPLSGSCSLGPARVGAIYSGLLTATGGAEPYTWSLVSGNMPPGLTLNPSGTVTGTPTAAGSSAFSARVRDSSTPQQTATVSCSIEVSSGVVASCSLEPGRVGVAYSGSLTASGGRTPYTWTLVSGSPPPGLTLAGSGTVSGNPTTAGDFTFGARVADSNTPPQTATTSCSLRIQPAAATLTATCSLAPARIGVAYSGAAQASGGTPPYTWRNETDLPAGLTIDTAGSIRGTPTAAGMSNFRLRVWDAGGPQQTAPANCALAVWPQINVTGDSTPSPTQATRVGVAFASPAPAPVDGTLTITFRPNAGDLPANYMDPMLQFAAGGVTMNFTAPAGASSAVMPQQGAIQQGTVAGEITVAITRLVSGGVNILPQPAPTRTITVGRSAPVISDGTVRLVNITSTGFEVELVAYSTTRELVRGNFVFRAGGTGQFEGQSGFDVDLQSRFRTWYASREGLDNGSMFRMRVPFTLSGDGNVLQGVSVTLTNSVGTSASAAGGR